MYYTSNLDYSLENCNSRHWYLVGDNTSITYQEVLVISPTHSKYNWQWSSVVTNNLNLKCGTWERYMSVGWHLSLCAHSHLLSTYLTSDYHTRSTEFHLQNEIRVLQQVLKPADSLTKWDIWQNCFKRHLKCYRPTPTILNIYLYMVNK